MGFFGQEEHLFFRELVARFDVHVLYLDLAAVLEGPYATTQVKIVRWFPDHTEAAIKPKIQRTSISLLVATLKCQEHIVT